MAFTKGMKNYSETDGGAMVNSGNGDLYYRLKIVDADGNFSYSKIQIISLKAKNTFVVNVFPNPCINKIDLSINSVQYDHLNAVITGATGKTFLNTKIKTARGSARVSINNLESFPKGIYFLKLTMGEQSQTFKIEK